MKYTILILVILSVYGCTDQVILEDNKYAKRWLSKYLTIGLPFVTVKNNFAQFDRDIELFQECEDKKLEDCPYMSIGTIPLKSDHWWLGQGDIQIYMTFNSDKKLESKFYEIYYPRYH